MQMQMFFAQDWYWTVGGDQTKVYSSKRNIYVATSDADFQQWGSGGRVASPADSEADIWYHVQSFTPLWLWNGTTMSQPAVGQYTKDQLANYNAVARYDQVVGGMIAAGVPVKTDDRSRGLIDGARTSATTDPNFTTKWYGSDGNFYDVDAAQMIEMSNAVGNHTNQCYIIFAANADAITVGTMTTLQQIDDSYSSV